MTSAAPLSAATPFTVRRALAVALRLTYAGLRVVLALSAATAYFLPWHPHADSDGSAPPWHNGYTAHEGGLLLPSMAVALAILGAVSARPAGPGGTALVETAGIGLCAVLLTKAFFEYFEHFWFEFVFDGAAWAFYYGLFALGVVWVVGPLIQLVLVAVRGPRGAP